MELIIDIEMVCRLCANLESDVTNMIPIFEGDELPDQISKYLHISVQEKQGTPNKVCASCTITLLNWHNFYQNCERTNQRFQQMYPQPTKPKADFTLLKNCTIESIDHQSENSSELNKILEDADIRPGEQHDP